MLAFVAMLSFAPISLASPADYKQAITDFQGKKYSQALAGFQAASRVNPNDPACHYYMALCYQYMNQVGQATAEYQWVATKSRDAILRAQAQSGLAQLSRYGSVRNVQAGSAAMASPASSGRPLYSPESGRPMNAPMGAPKLSAMDNDGGSFAGGRLKVIEFKTKWCGVCKGFEPVFQAAKSKSPYSSRCEFSQLDAEEPSNASLVQKYGVSGFPTVVFADSEGKQVNKFAGGTSLEGFTSMIDQALSKLH